jgi:natural resistance-associated macrophage protein
MPHNIYLYGGLVQSRGLDRASEVHVHQGNKYNFVDATIALAFSFVINAALLASFANGFFSKPCAENDGGQLACLPGATSPDPSATGAAMFPCTNQEGHTGYCHDIGLNNAGTALQSFFGGEHGRTAETIFALGVLAAGQASTMTGTLAGQYVMAGFLDWHVPIFVRTMITRSIALGPAIAVAVWTAESPGLGDKVNSFLNILQSVQLPFALLPVLHFCSDRRVMGNRFVLKHRFQVLCWVMALIVITINIYLVVQSVIGQPAWVWAITFVFFILYFALQFVIIRSDLVKLWNKVRGIPNDPDAGLDEISNGIETSSREHSRVSQ